MTQDPVFAHVMRIMRDGKARTLRELAKEIGCSKASVKMAILRGRERGACAMQYGRVGPLMYWTLLAVPQPDTGEPPQVNRSPPPVRDPQPVVESIVRCADQWLVQQPCPMCHRNDDMRVNDITGKPECMNPPCMYKRAQARMGLQIVEQTA